MLTKKILLLTILMSVFLMFGATQTGVLANTISVTDASISDWSGVTRFNDGIGDATGSGDLDLIKFWVTSDATNIYCRWDIILSTNKSAIKSAGYSIALTSIVPTTVSQPVAELLAFVGFAADGSVDKVALMKSGNLEKTCALTNAQAIGSGYGATVSVEAKFSYADINAFMFPNEFGPNSTNTAFPLWAQSHSSLASVKFSTASVADRCPDMGYLSFNSTTGTSIPVGTGPFASIVASVSNPNTTPGGTVNYTVRVTNIGDTTGAPKLLFNQIQWALPNTGFTYILGSTTGLVTSNPTQASVKNSLGITTTNLTWPVTGSLAPGESTTLYFRATAQNTAATNLLSEVHIVAQKPNITFDTGSVAPVELNTIYVTPATPINLVATNTTQTTTTLSWSASANATTYSVYDNGFLIQSGITGTSLNITGLSPSSTHNYTVKAISTYRIESSLSNSLQVIILAPYTVTFNSQGGSAVIGTTKLLNELLTAPTQPTKTNYIFDGWYKEANCTNIWNFASDAVTSNTTLYAKWTVLPQYTVTLNAGSNGTVVADPINATVFQGQTVTYTITPATGYEINTITYNDAPVVVTNGTYTTPAITSNATLTVTFSIKALVPPTIATSLSEKRNSITLNVKDKSGNLVENKSFEKTHITYATISNPDNFTLISQGMILKEVATGKWVDLPIANKSHSGQFAVHLFGLGVGPEMGFKVGNTYTLQSYLKYLDLDGVVKRVTIGEEKPFVWE